MGDDLKKYIQQNKAEFDDITPSEKIWDELDSQLNDKQPKKKFYWLEIAAGISIFLSVVLYYKYSAADTTKDVIATNESVIEEPQFSEIEIIEQEYKLIQEQKTIQLANYDYPNEQLKHTFKQDIAHLDSTYYVLKNQLKDGYDERIVNALIENLKMRIEIMNQQLQVLETVKKLKEEKHESTS